MHEASVMKSSENEEDSYWQNQKIGMKRFLPGNSLSYVFLPNHMLYPISTGVALCYIVVLVLWRDFDVFGF